MHKTKIDLKTPAREASIKLLSARLADAVDLATQAKQAHWNIKGPAFIALHELFDQVHQAVQEYTDLIAERITILGGTAEGTAAVAGDAGTSDLFTEVSRGVDKHLWFVEAHAQAER